MVEKTASYRGRLAPSPTGWLHLGHARTFWTAQERARAAGGTLILRNDDLDAARCRREYAAAMYEDLRWFGLEWSEGPDVGGPQFPYGQSQRLEFYAEAFAELREGGYVYPCTCSRKDVQSAAGAPHESFPSNQVTARGVDRAAGAPHESVFINKLPPGRTNRATGVPSDGATDEPLYLGTCRPENLGPTKRAEHEALARRNLDEGGANWRFHVPDGEVVAFDDGHFGAQRAVAGADFGDFLVWRKDGVPSYQLACAVDDALMGITEVVRGADLITSTFRQILLLRALSRPTPAYFHCPLVTDDQGLRLAKRHDALALRTLRAAGRTPEDLRRDWK